MHVVAESAQETQIGLHRLLELFFPVLILANQTVQCHILSPPTSGQKRRLQKTRAVTPVAIYINKGIMDIDCN
jgi:hypothetical protein